MSNYCNKEEIGRAILTFSIAAGVMGIIFAQALVANVPLILAIHVFLVLYIGRKCSDENYAIRTAFGVVTSILSINLLGGLGTIAAVSLGGFIPFIGNVLNAGVFFTATQSVGWTAYHFFK